MRWRQRLLLLAVAAFAASTFLLQPPVHSTATAWSIFPNTELGGDVVLWGANHLTATAEACCAVCSSTPGCSVCVHCSHTSCGSSHRQCWLKHLDSAWDEAAALSGTSERWNSGVLGTQPRPSPALPPAGVPELAIVLEDYGELRVALHPAAPLASHYLRQLVREAPNRTGYRFYRAEPVPPQWGSLDLADSWNGGRWGPPYALLQGSFRPEDTSGLPPAPAADRSQAAMPLIKRGHLAWAGGGGGPDAFIALANHPEWGHGHTVFGTVLESDMAVVDELMRTRAIRVESWQTINASVFVVPLPFTLRSLV